MNRTDMKLAVLAGVLVVAGANASPASRRAPAIEAAQAGTRSLPTFDVDRAWPNVPSCVNFST